MSDENKAECKNQAELKPQPTGGFMERLKAWRAIEGMDQSTDDLSDVFDDVRAKDQERDF